MQRLNSFSDFNKNTSNTDLNNNIQEQNNINFNDDLIIKYNELAEKHNKLIAEYNKVLEFNKRLLFKNKKLESDFQELKKRYEKFENNKGKGRKEKKLKYDVVMMREQGYSYRDIAKMLGVSVSTVYARIKKNQK